MKQMRSRFRLLTLLMVCAFLLTLVLCVGSALKTAGISLASLSHIGVSASPAPAGPSGDLSVPEQTPISSDPIPSRPETVPEENTPPSTDILQESEYNIIGL